MRSIQLTKLLLFLMGFVTVVGCACLSGEALEPKVADRSVHRKSSNGEGAGATSQTVDTTSSTAGDKAVIAEATPEAVFEASRQKLIKHFTHFNVSPDHPNANKLLDALKPTVTKYLDTPLKLTDKKVSGDTATLTYQSTDPHFDFSMTCDFTRADGKWSMTNESIKGQKGIELPGELYKDVVDTFPVQFGVLWLSVGIILLSLLVSSVSHIWLVVVACRASVPWGVASLLVPFVWIAFAVTHWQVAKKPVLTMVGATVISVLTLGVAIGVMYSLGDVVSAIPDTLMAKPSTKPLHEI